MSYKYNLNRVEVYKNLTLDESKEIACIDNLKYIQISAEISPQALEIINSVILSQKKDIQFRVYGFYGSKCDLKFLEMLTNITDLSIGAMDSVNNIDVIEKLSNLKKLRVYLNELKDISFLKKVTPNITSLMLGTGINNSNIELDEIERFHFLESLFVYKINKGFDIISKLNNLTQLTINEAKITDFSFLRDTNINNLSLGMIRNNNCNTLCGNQKIKKLELWKLNKLMDLNILNDLPNLEYVRIYQNNNIEKICDLRKCINLKTLILDELKNLKDISELAFIPNIENIELYQVKSINLADIEDILKGLSLKNFKCITGSIRKDNQIEELIKNVVQK